VAGHDYHAWTFWLCNLLAASFEKKSRPSASIGDTASAVVQEAELAKTTIIVDTFDQGYGTFL